MITVACVWNGTKYGLEYVTKLKSMVERNLTVAHRFVCYTDRPEDLPDGIDHVRTTYTGWWAKMELFDTSRRDDTRMIYFDLDTVICGELESLANWSGVFGICENFTRRAGNTAWPCKYGSCIMSLSPGWGRHIWRHFDDNADTYMSKCKRGDQEAIEKIQSKVDFLQSEMPDGYFVGYRDLSDEPDDKASIVVFGGRRNPDNTPHKWVMDLWQ